MLKVPNAKLEEGTGSGNPREFDCDKYPQGATSLPGADLGGGCRGCAPLPETTCLLLRICLRPITSQLCHSLVVHPLLKKNSGSQGLFQAREKTLGTRLPRVGTLII